MIFDPISDMFVRIKNANSLNHKNVSIPFSKIKLEIVKILKDEGFIENYSINGKLKANIIIKLKYGLNNEKMISGIKRISKPSLRINVNSKNIPYVLRGLGIAIISTNKGLMTDSMARKLKVGGEVIAYIW